MNISNQKLKYDGNNELVGALSSTVFLDENETLTIECWSCSKNKRIKRTNEKFVLYNVADRLDFIPKVDFKNNRVLVFCSDECVEKAKKKDGEFRVRRPR